MVLCQNMWPPAWRSQWRQLLPLAQSDAAGAAIVPPQTPSSNIFPAPGYVGPCGSLAAPNPYCPAGLTTVYGDRQVEGVSPMSLPSTWGTLTPPEQLFVLTNLERIDRGLAPIAGLAANLDAYAQAGANAGTRSALPALRQERWEHLRLDLGARHVHGPVDVRRRGRTAPMWAAPPPVHPAAGTTGRSSWASTPHRPSWGSATATAPPSSSWGETRWTRRTSPGRR